MSDDSDTALLASQIRALSAKMESAKRLSLIESLFKAAVSVAIAYWAVTTYIDTAYDSAIWKDRYSLCRQTTQLMGNMIGSLGHPADALAPQYSAAHAELKKTADSRQFDLYEGGKLQDLVNEFLAASPIPGAPVAADKLTPLDQKLRGTHASFTAECRRTTGLGLWDLVKKRF